MYGDNDQVNKRVSKAATSGRRHKAPLATDASVWLSKQQAAEYTGFSTRKIERLIAQGKLPASKLPGSEGCATQYNQVRIYKPDIDAYLQRKPTAEPSADSTVISSENVHLPAEPFDADDKITRSEAAQRLGVSKRTIQRYVQIGLLPSAGSFTSADSYTREYVFLKDVDALLVSQPMQ